MGQFMIGASAAKQGDSALEGQGENQEQPGAQVGGQGEGGGGLDIEAKLEELRQKYDQDINKLRSSLDRRYSEEKKRWEQENRGLKDQLRQVLGSTMDDEARAEFEAEQMRLDYQRMSEELEQSKQQAEAFQNMMAYAKWFNDLGVPMDKLNFESPEALMESAWVGLQGTVGDLKKEIEDYKKKVQSSKEQPSPESHPKLQVEPKQKDQETFTGSGTSAPAGDILEYVQKALTSRYGRPVSMDEVFAAIDNGAVDIDSLIQAGYKP